MLADWLPYARLSMAAYRALRFAHRKPNPNASLDPEPDPDCNLTLTLTLALTLQP